MKEEIESVLTPVERTESLTVALFPWASHKNDTDRELFVRALTRLPNLSIGKRESGQPYLINHPAGLSFSHTGKYLAVSVSSSHSPGVDIEHLRDKVIRIAPRVFSKDELESVKHFPRLPALHILWGAKEAVYKSFGKRGLHFISDIEVMPFVFYESGGDLQAKLQGRKLFNLRYKFYPDNLIVVYTTGVSII